MSNPIRYSTDITDRSPPSPAPTYRSTFHNSKDLASLSPSSSSSSLTHTTSPYAPDTNPAYHADEKKHYIANDKDEIDLLPEPFDTNHPYYIPPPSHLSLPVPPSPRRKASRFPPLKLLLPWTLCALFFLLSAWYTSIAFGVRLFTTLNPRPAQPVQIIINNGLEESAGGGVVTQTLTATATPTSKAFVPGNGVDLGSNTVTSRGIGGGGGGSSTVGSTQTRAAVVVSRKLDRRERESGFVTVTLRTG